MHKSRILKIICFPESLLLFTWWNFIIEEISIKNEPILKSMRQDCLI